MKFMSIVWLLVILIIGYWLGKNYPTLIPIPSMPSGM